MILFGIKPCLNKLENIKIIDFASSYSPGINKDPLTDIRTSLPKFLKPNLPLVKFGMPADIEILKSPNIPD